MEDSLLIALLKGQSIKLTPKHLLTHRSVHLSTSFMKFLLLVDGDEHRDTQLVRERLSEQDTVDDYEEIVFSRHTREVAYTNS